MNTKSVTFGVTTYEAIEYIERCLSSISSQRGVSLAQFEVLVADDGSTDGTPERAVSLLDELGLEGRVLRQENTGSPSTGRNRIVDEATGEYIYFIDVDDYLGEEAVGAMLGLASEESADVVIGKFVGVNRGAPRVMFEKTLSRTNINETPIVDSLNVLKMFRTEYVRSIGYRFNPEIRMAEDHPFALSAYAMTDRIAIQSDVDCYFCVRHLSEKGKNQHLTGHILPVDEFYKYFYETFDFMSQIDGKAFPLVEAAIGRYWHRLLYLDIPNEFRRARSDEDFHYSLLKASSIAEEYKAAKYTRYMSNRTRAMLRVLELRDDELAKRLAEMMK